MKLHDNSLESVYEKLLEKHGTELAKKTYKNRNKSEMSWINKVLKCKVGKIKCLGIKPPPTEEEIRAKRREYVRKYRQTYKLTEEQRLRKNALNREYIKRKRAEAKNADQH